MDPREEIVATARSLFTRSLTHGSSGNISLRVPEGALITPTGSSLGTVTPEELSLISLEGAHLDGPRPSKEAFLHAAMFRERPGAQAVIHTHSTHAAAVSCLDGLNHDDVLPPLTAYYAMRVGRLPLLPYHAPGDQALQSTVESVARENSTLLLSNHGPVVAGPALREALDALEELEETAKLFLMLHGMPVRPLTEVQRAQLAEPR
ncbi:3-oxo-tetronate 4-phosphate decarboxylase [Pseudarthrobacter sp. NamE5]|uniref:3-oxo-tetronate 4-phosphate decarboxylase n=1 Tax=Pseudarthrobacter sp. NamE5 TaxID=2576839 RepID=UPI00110A3371|nr:3-oxo-tetronate 4-phosphate decarboxylase [Pseudarthrobacter sp. NamE5]TLM80955.1 aldolase [Pseudarthrobacter sp. NamE5]